MPNLDEQEGLMNLIFKSNPAKSENEIGNIILDFDMFFYSKKDNLFELDQFESIIEKGHNYILKMFESSITDKIRKLIE